MHLRDRALVRGSLRQAPRRRTLIVKPKQHVVHVAGLSSDESAEIWTLLRQAAEVLTGIESPEQVYVTLWSHMHAVPGHIHFVVQPVTKSRMAEHDGKHGCRLQVEMFDRGILPDPHQASLDRRACSQTLANALTTRIIASRSVIQPFVAYAAWRKLEPTGSEASTHTASGREPA